MTETRSTASWGFVVTLLTSSLFFYFDGQGRPGTGRAAWACSAALLTAIAAHWELKTRPWFWGTIAALLAVHVPLVLYAPWPGKWIPGIGILVLGMLDIAIIFGCISLVKKLIERRVKVSADPKSVHP